MPRSPPADVNGSEHHPTDDAERSLLDALSPTVICGLQNIGNTCYFNSGLQVLANVGAFVSALRYGSPFVSDASTKAHADAHPYHTTARFRLFQHTRLLLDQMTSTDTLCVAPTDLVHQFASVHSAFEGLQQQDTTEMLTGLLSEIEDLTKVPVAVPEALEELATSSVPVHPSSRSFLHMLQIRNEVNQANALEETREQHAQGNLSFQPSDYVPPTITLNTAVDCFRGHMLHRIVCSECQYVSRTVEEFTSLAVDIPLKRQRTQFEHSRPHVNRYDAEGTLLNPTADSGGDHHHHDTNNEGPSTAGGAAEARRRAVVGGSGWSWWNPLRLVACVWSFLWTCCVGVEQVAYSLTLEECLDMYFADEQLTGSNLYHCPKCRKKTAATKSRELLWCPEYLVVHLKRFQVGSYWTYKRHDAVIFPLGSDAAGSKKRRPLDMRPFSVCVNPSTTSGGDGGGGGSAAVPYLGSQQYQLTGVVNHHGSYGGGHYTAFAYKGPSMGWVLTNDASISRATEDDVAESQEYLLVYRKLPLQTSSGSATGIAAAASAEHAHWQDRARSYLLAGGTPALKTAAVGQAKDEGKRKSVLVSRSWLHRVATFAEPGPLLNRLCYSGPQVARGGPDCRRPLVSPVGHYMGIDGEDFRGMVAFFGGCPTTPTL